jgi:predicted HAD superfamily Cof-like phosphohydrolase
MTTTTNQFESVVEFMSVAGQEVNTSWKNPTTKVGNFRLRLIDEEMNGKNELFDSVDTDNLEGILDGICDVLYVAYGAYATFGLESIEHEVYSHLQSVKSQAMTISSAYDTRRHVQDGYNQTERGLVQGDRRTIQIGLNNIVLSVIGIAHAHNFDLIGAFNEVHQSNMSKFCKTRTEADESIKARVIEGKNDYIGATTSEVTHNGNTFYIINRAGDGKVLKGMGFFEPDLSKFIVQ